MCAQLLFGLSLGQSSLGQAGLKLDKLLRITLNFWSSSIQLPNTDIKVGGRVLPRPVYDGLGLQLKVLCFLGKHSTYQAASSTH